VRSTARGHRLEGGVIETSLAAAALVGVIEAIALTSGQPGVLLAVAGLLLGLGLAIGAVMLASEVVVARWRLRGPLAAAARAAGALIALVPVGRTLFDGARASTLPGASTAAIWFPALGFIAVAAAITLGQRLLAGTRWLSERRASALVAGALAVLAIVVELANRRMFRTEYPHVHLLLVLVSITSVAVALRVSLGGRLLATHRRAWPIRAVLATATIAVLLASLRGGLQSESERWVVATRGNHTRHVAALARTLLDRDGDGYAAVLGGGDCDDGDASRYPSARDIADNGLDEDCDGRDATPIAALAPDRVRSLAEYTDSDAARQLRARLTRANLVLISVDALRADVVADPDPGAHPSLSRLLARSHWFTNAVAPSSGTDVSLSSLLTGRVDPFVPIDRTLLEALRDSGRTTHAVLPSEVLRWAPETLLTRGLDGVDRIVNDRFQENVGNYTTSVETTDRGLAFLDGVNDKPFALWLHYFDVHEHKQIDADDLELRKKGDGKGRSTTERKYRALLELVDDQLARVMARLDERGLIGSTVIVLFSDHGESLGEDPRLPDNHGMYVYRALTAVPFAIRVPGIAAARVDEPVSLIDLRPTLEDLLGLKPAERNDGRSLFALLVPEPPPAPLYPERVLVLNESHQWGVIQWPMKLMVRPRDNLVELYDLAADPDETTNLASARAETVRQLKQRYDQFDRVSFDRSKKGRRWRQAQAQPPPQH
jgi:hypothetical protein